MPESPVIVDTGPLVALLGAADRYHAWAAEQFRRVHTPLYSCEAVLTETAFLLSRVHGGRERFLDLLASDLLSADFRVMHERAEIAQLMRKYADVPMSLADACMVRMVELMPGAQVMTLDSDFRLYRQCGRRMIPLISP